MSHRLTTDKCEHVIDLLNGWISLMYHFKTYLFFTGVTRMTSYKMALPASAFPWKISFCWSVGIETCDWSCTFISWTHASGGIWKNKESYIKWKCQVFYVLVSTSKQVFVVLKVLVVPNILISHCVSLRKHQCCKQEDWANWQHSVFRNKNQLYNTKEDNKSVTSL